MSSCESCLSVSAVLNFAGERVSVSDLRFSIASSLNLVGERASDIDPCFSVVSLKFFGERVSVHELRLSTDVSLNLFGERVSGKVPRFCVVSFTLVAALSGRDPSLFVEAWLNVDEGGLSRSESMDEYLQRDKL